MAEGWSYIRIIICQIIFSEFEIYKNLTNTTVPNQIGFCYRSIGRDELSVLFIFWGRVSAVLSNKSKTPLVLTMSAIKTNFSTNFHFSKLLYLPVTCERHGLFHVKTLLHNCFAHIKLIYICLLSSFGCFGCIMNPVYMGST